MQRLEALLCCKCCPPAPLLVPWELQLALVERREVTALGDPADSQESSCLLRIISTWSWHRKNTGLETGVLFIWSRKQ